MSKPAKALVAILATISALCFDGIITYDAARADDMAISMLYNTLQNATVAALPVCNSATIGAMFLVTNSLVPVLGVQVAGGGAVTVAVRCNGTLWLVI